MFGRHKDPHPSVYLLADHLDAILAAGEDLAALRLDFPPSDSTHAAAGTSGRDGLLVNFIAHASTFEISIAAHLRQARVHGKEVAGADKRFASLIRLFLGGTAMIDDALADYAAPDARTFQHGNDPTAYLRARNLLDDEAGSPGTVQSIVPGEDMLVAGRIELGPLLDLVSAFLDSLDLAYDLYPDLPVPSSEPTASGKPDAAVITAPMVAAAAATKAPTTLRDALKAMK